MKPIFDVGLSHDRRERITCVAEEGGEITQAATKILRHGMESRYENGESNREALEREIGQLEYLIERLKLAGDIGRMAVHTHREEYAARFRKYTHFQHDSDDWRANP